MEVATELDKVTGVLLVWPFLAARELATTPMVLESWDVTSMVVMGMAYSLEMILAADCLYFIRIFMLAEASGSIKYSGQTDLATSFRYVSRAMLSKGIL